MVQRNGGKIWVESEPGKGTVMQFTVLQTSAPASLNQSESWQEVFDQG
jgi:signal transduction histidine kinase